MDERRARIHDDLRGIVAGELLFEPIERAPYAIDGSIYEIDPLGVLVPRSEADVISVVKYAAENQIPLHPRGAGTSLAGEPLGPGLVLDFSRHFRRIVEIDADSVTVEPGVVLDVVNHQLAQFGRMIGPDPSYGESRTIGGILGGDGCGMRSLKYGTIGDYVESLAVVFANGETGRLEAEPWPDTDDESNDYVDNVRRKVATIARHHADSLARCLPRSPRNRAGYALGKAIRGDELDLARLVVGSEGTLALITEARLRTVPIPSAQGVAVLPFARLSDAAEVVEECLYFSPSSCDLFDWRSLRLARDFLPDTRAWIPDVAEALLMVEFLADDPLETGEKVKKLVRRIRRRGKLIGPAEVATRRADCSTYLSLRSRVRPLTMRIRSAARPIALIEDVAVPPSELAPFLQSVQTIMKSREVSWTLYGHVGHGQLHIRPFLDLSNPEHVDKLEPLAAEVYEAALERGGTISGEHGCGLARTQFLRRQFGELFHAFRDIKDAFDPFGILNPGKVIGDDPHLLTRNLRAWPEPTTMLEMKISSGFGSSAEVPIVTNVPTGLNPTEEAVEHSGTAGAAAPSKMPTDLRWPGLSMLETSSCCNGCGACRSREPDLRMCPTFRATGEEAASPRSQANLVRQIALGVTDPKLWGSEELKQNAELCIHCTRCKSECPAGVDVSSLMIEAKAAYVEHHGLSPGDWASSRMELWAKLGTRFPIIANVLIRNSFARCLMDRFFGLSRYRQFPKFQRSSFLYRAGRLGLSRPRPHAPGPRVAYFVDLFANYFDQELAEAVVAVLRQAGVNVFVPRRQRPSGMASLVVGDLEHARDLAVENIRILGNAVRDGYTVVCSEPTATMMIRQEYPKLTEDLDAALVARNTLDLGEYLKGLQARGQLPTANFPIRARVGYHQPCHQRSLEIGTPGLDLLRLIPGLDVEYIDRGCSGMAGTFGLKSKNFRTSLRAGRPLLRRLRDRDIEFGSTECGACRLQMEHNTSKRTLHPIKLLSLAYGLNPQLLHDLRQQAGADASE